MPGRVYRVPFAAVAITVQQDFFEVLAGANKLTELLEFHLSQVTKVGDANEAELALLLKTGQTVTGSGGSTVTPIPAQLGDAAFAGTCKANNTTKAGTGTIVTHEAWNWNIRMPFSRIFTPETIIAIGANRLTLELATTPPAITVSGVMVLREQG